MEHLSSEQFVVLANPGVTSLQLLSPHNSKSARVTLTKVVVAPSAIQPRHSHSSSEQIWYVISGIGQLLLANDEHRPISAGDVVRFADGDVHGLENSGTVPFEYLSVTSPPINFDYAYANTGA
jgi:mannose-6-phosphate isomerase-like protein (cupin superfamily)